MCCRAEVVAADGSLSLEMIANAVVAIDAIGFRSRGLYEQLEERALARELLKVRWMPMVVLSVFDLSYRSSRICWDCASLYDRELLCLYRPRDSDRRTQASASLGPSWSLQAWWRRGTGAAAPSTAICS